MAYMEEVEWRPAKHAWENQVIIPFHLPKISATTENNEDGSDGDCVDLFDLLPNRVPLQTEEMPKHLFHPRESKEDGAGRKKVAEVCINLDNIPDAEENNGEDEDAGGLPPAYHHFMVSTLSSTSTKTEMVDLEDKVHPTGTWKSVLGKVKAFGQLKKAESAKTQESSFGMITMTESDACLDVEVMMAHHQRHVVDKLVVKVENQESKGGSNAPMNTKHSDENSTANRSRETVIDIEAYYYDDIMCSYSCVIN